MNGRCIKFKFTPKKGHLKLFLTTSLIHIITLALVWELYIIASLKVIDLLLKGKGITIGDFWLAAFT